MLSVGVLLSSSNFVVARGVRHVIAPIDLSFWRWLAALGMAVVMARTHIRRDLPALRRCWPSLLLLSGVGVAGMNVLIYQGLQSTTAVNALLLQSATPLLLLAFAIPLQGRRRQPRQVGAVMIAVAGMAAIAAQGAPDAAGQAPSFGGDLWIVAAMVCYALYTVLLRRPPAVHPTSLMAASFALGAAILLPLEMEAHLLHPTALPTAASIVAVLYLALFPSIVAVLLANRGVELIGVARAAQFGSLLPVFGIALAWAVLGETMQPHHVAGVAAIACGLLLAGSVSPNAPTIRRASR